MAAPSQSGGEPIAGKTQLVEFLEGGCKVKANWRIGTEHEKFGFDRATFAPLAYEGVPGIRALLEGMQRFSWMPVYEEGNVIALRCPSGASISLEPGGQFELSGAMLETIHETCNEVHTHLAQVREVCDEIGAGMLGLGFTPKARREDIGWMPKGRYKIMGDYMPKKGKLGIDMMTRTCTVQVNLDYSSEPDMIKKMRVAVALQPVATALFANSPFIEGRPGGLLSHRSETWKDTDPDRCGMLPFVFEEGFGFERWVDYVLDVPMYFVYREGRYVDVAGKSFRDFMNGSLEGFKGEIPTMSDWQDHMTTVFPEVRLKRFIEMRGADGGPWRRLCALPALWVGLLYDQSALDAAWDLCRDWTVEEMQALRDVVPRDALKAEFRGESLQQIALRVLEIARHGLERRRRTDGTGGDETCFLNALDEIAASGVTPAEELLAAYHGRWQGDIDRLFEEYAY